MKKKKVNYPPSHLKRIQMPGVGKGNNPAGHRGIIFRFGIKNGNSVLKNSDIKSIRSKHLKGYSMKELGKMYGVSSTQISRIVKRVNWRHV